MEAGDDEQIFLLAVKTSHFQNSPHELILNISARL